MDDAEQVVVWSKHPQLQPLGMDEIPFALRTEVASLLASKWVRSDSVRCAVMESSDERVNTYLVFLTVRREQYSAEKDLRFRGEEPIALVYQSGRLGQSCPNIYSDREDFPNDVAHLNPVATSHPQSPCLSIAGTQALYESRGIAGVVERLSEWLFDAAMQKLESDGWEPTPTRAEHYHRPTIVELDIAHFQRVANDSRRNGIQRFLSVSLINDKGAFLVVSSEQHDREGLWQKIRPDGGTEGASNDRVSTTPVFLLVPGQHNTSDHRFTQGLSDLAELVSWLQRRDFDSERVVIERELMAQAKRATPFVVMVGLRRPVPIRRDIPGTADGSAGSIELLSFLIEWDPGNPGSSKVSRMEPHASLTPSLLQSTSGISTPLPKCALVGAGALGSNIANGLIRSGLQNLRIIDPDFFQSHNVARHTTFGDGLYPNKAEHLKSDLARAGTANIVSKDLNIASVPAGQIARAIGNGNVRVIDATADISSLRRLSANDVQQPVIRTELANGGLMGIAYFEGKGRTPRLDDLEAFCYSLAVNEAAVERWMHEDRGLENVPLGLGCASTTMVMPGDRVSLHASAMMPLIRNSLTSLGTDGLIALNLLDDNGLPAGIRTFPVPAFDSKPMRVLNAPDEKPWECRLDSNIPGELLTRLKSAAPKEAGGYLFGRFDSVRRTITVIHAYPVDSLSASPGGITLKGFQECAEGLELLTKTNGKIAVVGSWHTHPGGGAKPSRVDIEQAHRIEMDNRETPIPSIMMIVAPDDLSVELVYPETWLTPPNGERHG